MRRIIKAVTRNLYDLTFFGGAAATTVGAVWSWFRITPFETALLGIAVMWATIERRHARREAHDWETAARNIGDLHHRPLGYPVGHSIIGGTVVASSPVRK